MLTNKILRKVSALLSTLCLLSLSLPAGSQPLAQVADSIRKAYHIPELGYAVLSADSVLELYVCGITKINTGHAASLTDCFRIGSNTKAITGFIAALLVQQGRLSWDTKFFDLYPELKAKSDPAYYNLSLLDLLSFRARLYPYTYTYALPAKGQFPGNEEQQRYGFAAWFLQHKPVSGSGPVHFSNLCYIAAGLMLEQASGKPYKLLVKDLGDTLHIDFGFGQPNNINQLQPWGHDKDLIPEPPGNNYKLGWLLPAGNINVSLPGYAKFIQLQLQGLQGRSSLLSKDQFAFLHFGLPTFAVGWFWERDGDGHLHSYNTGNPGTFLSMVHVYPDAGRAYIIFSNAQTPEAEAGMNKLLARMQLMYGF